MTTAKSNETYSTGLIRLHWIMALLMVAVYATIEFREVFEKGSAPREALKSLHFMLGLSILALVAVRIFIRSRQAAPEIVPAPHAMLHLGAKLGHAALYLFMICMPVAGWLILSASGKPIPFFGLELPALIGPDKDLAGTLKEVHEVVGQFGYFLIGLHAVAALVHHYVFKDNTLALMKPSRGAGNA
jgi:cytochrome b561